MAKPFLWPLIVFLGFTAWFGLLVPIGMSVRDHTMSSTITTLVGVFGTLGVTLVFVIALFLCKGNTDVFVSVLMIWCGWMIVTACGTSMAVGMHGIQYYKTLQEQSIRATPADIVARQDVTVLYPTNHTFLFAYGGAMALHVRCTSLAQCICYKKVYFVPIVSTADAAALAQYNNSNASLPTLAVWVAAYGTMGALQTCDFDWRSGIAFNRTDAEINANIDYTMRASAAEAVEVEVALRNHCSKMSLPCAGQLQILKQEMPTTQATPFIFAAAIAGGVGGLAILVFMGTILATVVYCCKEKEETPPETATDRWERNPERNPQLRKRQRRKESRGSDSESDSSEKRPKMPKKDKKTPKQDKKDRPYKKTGKFDWDSSSSSASSSSST